jgi:hypothetical protein
MKTCNNELLMEMRKIVYYSSESHWTTRHYTHIAKGECYCNTMQWRAESSVYEIV